MHLHLRPISTWLTTGTAMHELVVILKRVLTMRA